MPKIYAFSNTSNGGEGEALAIAEDGMVLASHWCSNEGWVPHDLGVTSDWNHEHYKDYYPEGFEVEYVSSEQFEAHVGLQQALSKNRLLPVSDE